MSKFVEYFVTDILEPHQGNAIYTKKNVISQNWGGDIPVISSDVKTVEFYATYLKKNYITVKT